MKVHAILLIITLLMAAACAGPRRYYAREIREAYSPRKVAACTAKGGQIEPVGIARAQCVVPFEDGGNPCTDSSQCLGICEVNFEQSKLWPKSGDEVAGRCQRASYPSGCKSEVVNGKAEFGICED